MLVAVLAGALLAAGRREPLGGRPASGRPSRSARVRARGGAADRRRRARALIAAWPTWIDLSGSLKVANEIASTTNSGNLHSPLRAEQVLGVWLNGSYKLAPAGSALALTHALIALTLVAAVLGAVHVLRIRAYALAGWIALMLLAWLAIERWVTTWGSAKTLMLTSPVVVLLAWGGVGALRSCPAARSRLRARRCSRSRCSAACSPPTSCSTAPPTSRPPPATKSSPR